MEDKNRLDRENQIENNSQKEHPKSGEIRYRLDQKSRIKNGAFQLITLFIVVIVTSVTTATYVSRKIQENPLGIDDNSNFSQMIRKSLDNFGNAFYDRTRIREIYKEVSLSLVGVANNPELFYGDSYEGVYTGVVMNSEGYILVPYDVTNLTDSEIFIRTDRDNDRIYQAEVVGRDTASGLAVLQVEGLGLRPPKFSDSSTVKVAQSVIAMGNPFGDSDR
ncbi:trypsin-like peptidase domain-containing protein, partial [Proteiniclasticum ruminis]|uniref:trypsin-like peptidase domain-containing protein n=1 Tax=Proteiniclasticum ruminis TaxID=398199 RepID=UPI00289DCB4C